MTELDNISKLQSYEDYIANNIAEWEAESIARVCRKIGKIGKMSKEEAKRFNADKEAQKEWERILSALAIATALNMRSLKKAYTNEFECWHNGNKYLYDYRQIPFVEISEHKEIQGIVDRSVRRNAKEILNLTNTKALSVIDSAGNPIRFQDAIYKSFGEAVKTVTQGKSDFYSAMRKTVQNLGGGGCRVD
jgi:polyhydroxyalkanoate synthesis regulator phasin